METQQLKLNTYLSNIQTLNSKAMKIARARIDDLAKPPGSLGKLEEIAVQLAGISGDIFYDIQKRCVIIMAADNGVVEEGVASTPQSVTYTQTINFIRGTTGVAVLARQFHADLMVVDVGINHEFDHPHIINKKIRKSTWNIAKCEAMTYDEAVRAILTGIETAGEAVSAGYRLLGTGEMGIGNTTTSSAVLSALTGLSPQQSAGKGAGLAEDAYQHKIQVIKTALQINRPDASDPIDILAKVGGFDIAALTGVFIGSAYRQVPVVIDGFISMVAALTAYRLCPAVRNYMIASHTSLEQGFVHAAQALGIQPYMNLDMRLGEGSGCPIMFAVMDAACAMIRDMETFEQAEINKEYIYESGAFTDILAIRR